MSEISRCTEAGPGLDADQLDDAAFRAKDRAWVALARLFDTRSRSGLTYAQLGKRINRSRAHVQRWLASPFNLSLKSLGLLAEGLDADLIIDVRPRLKLAGSNYCHPSEDAKEAIQNRPIGLFVPASPAPNSEAAITSKPAQIVFKAPQIDMSVDA